MVFVDASLMSVYHAEERMHRLGRSTAKKARNFMPEAPGTLEGWYVLHDFRRIDWPRWKALAEDERAAVIAEATAFLEAAEAHRDAEEGASALYWIVGHKADFMFLHLRPT